jgi:hypothetical protein
MRDARRKRYFALFVVLRQAEDKAGTNPLYLPTDANIQVVRVGVACGGIA